MERGVEAAFLIGETSAARMRKLISVDEQNSGDDIGLVWRTS
jgi:hypothetical protein|tara:strand:+ start:226 stop:351 length:126 start_codon:yes stop_codon:yes gene_type:complete